jgi:hypothetical protein
LEFFIWKICLLFPVTQSFTYIKIKCSWVFYALCSNLILCNLFCCYLYFERYFCQYRVSDWEIHSFFFFFSKKGSHFLPRLALTSILLISASWVARITSVNHQHLVRFFFLSTLEMLLHCLFACIISSYKSAATLSFSFFGR